MKNLLGGKGANLAEMSNLGIPVPPGFTISTEVCTYYYANGETYPETLKDEVMAALAQVEEVIGLKFGSVADPLLVSAAEGQYRLTATSPCVNAGTAAGAPSYAIGGAVRTGGPEPTTWALMKTPAASVLTEPEVKVAVARLAASV